MENDGILPLKENAQKILITGYNADNKLAYLGNYFGDPSHFVMVTDAVSQYNRETEFIRGIHLYDSSKSIDEEQALKKAQESDIILMCTGIDSSIEGEEAGGALAGGGGNIGKQGDRETIDLPLNQQKYIEKLIDTGKKIILLNFSGGCINFGKFKSRVNAIVQCWYPGAQGGKAIADILFGKCSPSGKLPITFYNSTDDLPDFCDYSMQNRTYRYFKGNVQYPFGYGRTYTKFSLEDITLIGEEIKATICNIGNEKSDTVLQLYVSYPPTEYPNPQKSLVSFKRIGLKPGERETITFKITSEYLTSANNDGKKEKRTGLLPFVDQRDRHGYGQQSTRGIRRDGGLCHRVLRGIHLFPATHQPAFAQMAALRPCAQFLPLHQHVVPVVHPGRNDHQFLFRIAADRLPDRAFQRSGVGRIFRDGSGQPPAFDQEIRLLAGRHRADDAFGTVHRHIGNDARLPFGIGQHGGDLPVRSDQRVRDDPPGTFRFVPADGHRQLQTSDGRFGQCRVLCRRKDAARRLFSSL